MMSSEVFNEAAFFNHLGGDRELGAEILDVYLIDAPDRLRSLSEAVEKNDQNLVIKYSHALKGISATIRAEKIARISEIIELAARQGDFEKVRACFPDIVNELEKTLKVLKEYLGVHKN
ncbi:HPt (histidine-containing phosphotransfer) domain-containing protein [Maridesulfovibrio ferrireducens]|uniref:HPt (Histidine-containing phosphotransfer) domain-containing protein n=1 Tax=Maridesulfovibrio ferrireducens TaxID=246191 RepID=A0A1G9KEH1_9BACT|nr:Hpt domain-containing protein [Maridesulfovibrio ferrireducens]SDL47982.1 HPt (histidine-containing phosphotransfer) domain-containing protein [Maridesulfovibrio ferrireducens]